MDMDKKVILTITGSQRSPKEEDKTIELITVGRLYRENDTYCIEFEESLITGMGGTKTIITVEQDRVSLERCGLHHTHLIFEKGKKYINCFNTPFGIQELGIYPIKINSSMDESQGRLNLKYQLDIGGRYTSSNELSLCYTENAKGVFPYNESKS
jgi:uncharacterized beta-barrel protein YwiB (DUF1934 family)